jgi:hypothetical protein
VIAGGDLVFSKQAIGTFPKDGEVRRLLDG